MHAIQSLKSKRYFNLLPDASIKWEIGIYTSYKNELEADQAIRLYSLREVEIVPLFNKTPDKVTRVERNLEFISTINQQAARFKMKTVGVKSIDKLINTNLGTKPRILAKTQHEILCCYNTQWYNITYRFVDKFKILIVKFHLTNEPQQGQRVGYLEGSELTVTYYGCKYNSENEKVGKVYTVVEEYEEIVEEDRLSSFRRDYSQVKKLVWRYNNKWYYVYYIITEPGRVTILNYEETNEDNINIDMAKIDPKFVNVLTIIGWDGIEKNTFKVMNVHGMIK
jgi:hypothetical protein